MKRATRQSLGEILALIDEYVAGVVSGERVVGKLQRLAVERHVRDLKRADGKSLRFNEFAAARILRFATCCRHTKGEWAGKRFRFEKRSAWMAFILWALFGWQRIDIDTGRWVRRFRTAYISVARKNGKTMLLAIIALFMLTADHEPASEVYFAATKRDQAKIAWKQAAWIVRKSGNPAMKRLVQIVDSRSHMHLADDPESFCCALGRDAGDTDDGTNPHLGGVDELHQHKDRETWDTLESGMGSRAQPMMVGITTAGGARKGLCWDLDHDAARIVEGTIQDDSSFGFIARPDDGDEWDSEIAWQKANPNLGVSVKIQKLRDSCRKAKNNIANLNEFRRKHCNQWSESDTAWLPMTEWQACEAAFALESLEGRECIAGLDLAAVSDYCALALVFPPVGEEKVYRVIPHFWIPSDRLDERRLTDRVPIHSWVEQGLVTATGGSATDQDAIKMHLLNLRERFTIREVAMDPHEAMKLYAELEALQFTATTIKQGFWLSPYISQTERLIRRRELAHEGNPVMRWMLSNVSVQTNAIGRTRLDKDRSGDKIDGIVAMVMAVGRATVLKQSDEVQFYGGSAAEEQESA